VLFMTANIPVKNTYSFFRRGQLYGLSGLLGACCSTLIRSKPLGNVVSRVRVGAKEGNATEVELCPEGEVAPESGSTKAGR
jgi:hypothetical protein